MSEEKIEFKAGDVVQLKSGGPLMIVYSEDNSMGYGMGCGWFHDGKYQNASFFKEQLKHAGETQ